MPIAPPTSARVRELLAWLALEPGPHLREPLAARFWPDVLDASARASLRNVVWRLRADLGAGAGHLLATRERVGLTGGVWTDVGAFDELVHEDRLEEALELGRGVLLADLNAD